MILPEEYCVQKFFSYAGYPQYNKNSKLYLGCCPICREGHHWGKKKRLYYFPSKGRVFCHNCGFNNTILGWILTTSGLSMDDILEELQDYNILPSFTNTSYINIKEDKVDTPRLPLDCVNLLDNDQMVYYSGNKVVQDALSFIKRRRWSTAINKPLNLFISLNDRVHKNRVIIPFYDRKGDIIYYQSRSLYDSQPVKFLSKEFAQKPLYNIGCIDIDTEYVFMFEGPSDAFFVENSLAVGGINENSEKLFTNYQNEQLSDVQTDIKWVLDSQWIDTASLKKTKILLEQNQTVFIWPKSIGAKHKDFNSICMDMNIDKISHDFILKRCYRGLEGLLELSKIKLHGI